MSTLFPHPVLHQDTLDYSDPKAYQATFKRMGKTTLVVEHTLRRDTLIASLIEQEKASFYCTVSIGGTAFRKTEPAPASIRDGSITAHQEIEHPAFVNRYDVFASAGVLNHEAKRMPWEKATGIDAFYKDETSDLEFSAGAMLACSGWRHFYPMDALFRIKSNSDLNTGVFQAEPSYQPTIRITIQMNNKLYDEVEGNSQGTVRSHVLCASLIPVLKELEEKYKRCSEKSDTESLDTDRADLEAAEGLKRFLISKEIPTWEDEAFNAVEAASKFKPAMLDDREE